MPRRPGPAHLLCLLALVLAAPASASAAVNGRIAFVRGADIYAMNPDGTGVAALTAGAGQNNDPAWSPGGTRLAFTSDRAGSEDIYVMDADGTGVRRLTDSAAAGSDPARSPDGRRDR